MNIRGKEKLKETQYKLLNEENTKFEGNTYMAFNAEKERKRRNWQRKTV